MANLMLVAELYDSKKVVTFLVGWPETICGRKLYGRAYTELIGKGYSRVPGTQGTMKPGNKRLLELPSPARLRECRDVYNGYASKY